MTCSLATFCQFCVTMSSLGFLASGWAAQIRCGKGSQKGQASTEWALSTCKGTCYNEVTASFYLPCLLILFPSCLIGVSLFNKVYFSGNWESALTALNPNPPFLTTQISKIHVNIKLYADRSATIAFTLIKKLWKEVNYHTCTVLHTYCMALQEHHCICAILMWLQF